MPTGPLQPAPSPTGGDPPITVDIAGTGTIQSTRRVLAEASGQLRLRRLPAEQRQKAGRTLSAAELRLARAISRLLGRRPQAGEDAGVPAASFDRSLETDLALSRLGRAAGEAEATSAIGEILLQARLTEENDRVFQYASSGDMTPAERDMLRTYLASADLIYEREIQLLQARRDRAAIRRGKNEEELAQSHEETERLRRRAQLPSGNGPEK